MTLVTKLRFWTWRFFNNLAIKLGGRANPLVINHQVEKLTEVAAKLNTAAVAEKRAEQVAKVPELTAPASQSDIGDYVQNLTKSVTETSVYASVINKLIDLSDTTKLPQRLVVINEYNYRKGELISTAPMSFLSQKKATGWSRTKNLSLTHEAAAGILEELSSIMDARGKFCLYDTSEWYYSFIKSVLPTASDACIHATKTNDKPAQIALKLTIYCDSKKDSTNGFYADLRVITTIGDNVSTVYTVLSFQNIHLET